MKIVKLIMAMFALLFALMGIAGILSFDAVVPCVVVCSALTTFADAKRLEFEKRHAEARSVKNAAMFMVLLAMVWFFYKFV